jgi:hypothetical protein
VVASAAPATGTGAGGVGIYAYGGSASGVGQTPGLGANINGGNGSSNNIAGSDGMYVSGGSGNGSANGAPAIRAFGGAGGATGNGSVGILTGGGSGVIGGSGLQAFGVVGSGNRDGKGVVAFGSTTGAPLHIGPNGGAPPATKAHDIGDVWLTDTGTMYTCVSGGAPGTWFRVGGTNYLPTPFRLVDTRITGGPLGAGERRTFTIAPSGSAPNNVPGGGLISGVLINVTAVPAPVGHTNSYFTVLPKDAPAIPAGNDAPYSTVNWITGQLQANLVAVRVPAATGQIDVFNRAGNVDLIIDVIGFTG